MKYRILLLSVLLFSFSSLYSQTLYLTKGELLKYNGKNGNPAYVAINNIIYDVSKVREWKSGKHHGHSAGRDWTKAISHAPHKESVLKKLTVVGTIIPALSSKEVSLKYNSSNYIQTNGLLLKKGSKKVIGKLLPRLTLKELSYYTGKDGKPAYVAVDGLVYNVSHLRQWRQGAHHGHNAGRDLSKAIKKSPHGKAILKRAILVAELAD